VTQKTESKVIVVIPTYNRAHYLEQALENISRQSYNDMKVVVLDNASTDETPEVFTETVGKDNRFFYSRNETTISAAENFYRGLSITSSEYFMWRADDDLSDANYVEMLTDALDRDIHSELAFASYLQSRGDFQKKYELPDIVADTPLDRAVQFLPIARPTWIYGLWRRDALNENIRILGDRYPYVWASDHALMLPTMMKGLFSPVQSTLFHQRIVGTASYHLSPLDLLRARKAFMEFGLSVLDGLGHERVQRKRLLEALTAHVEARVAPRWKTRQNVLKQLRRSIRDSVKFRLGMSIPD